MNRSPYDWREGISLTLSFPSFTSNNSPGHNNLSPHLVASRKSKCMHRKYFSHEIRYRKASDSSNHRIKIEEYNIMGECNSLVSPLNFSQEKNTSLDFLSKDKVLPDNCSNIWGMLQGDLPSRLVLKNHLKYSQNETSTSHSSIGSPLYASDSTENDSFSNPDETPSPNKAFLASDSISGSTANTKNHLNICSDIQLSDSQYNNNIPSTILLSDMNSTEQNQRLSSYSHEIIEEVKFSITRLFKKQHSKNPRHFTTIYSNKHGYCHINSKLNAKRNFYEHLKLNKSKLLLPQNLSIFRIFSTSHANRTHFKSSKKDENAKITPPTSTIFCSYSTNNLCHQSNNLFIDSTITKSNENTIFSPTPHQLINTTSDAEIKLSVPFKEIKDSSCPTTNTLLTLSSTSENENIANNNCDFSLNPSFTKPPCTPLYLRQLPKMDRELLLQYFDNSQSETLLCIDEILKIHDQSFESHSSTNQFEKLNLPEKKSLITELELQKIKLLVLTALHLKVCNSLKGYLVCDLLKIGLGTSNLIELAENIPKMLPYLKHLEPYQVGYSGHTKVDENKSDSYFSIQSQMVSFCYNHSICDSKEKLCLCGQSSFGVMISCENPKCNFGTWFHFSCVGITEEPTEDWRCPGCTCCEFYLRAWSTLLWTQYHLYIHNGKYIDLQENLPKTFTSIKTLLLQRQNLVKNNGKTMAGDKCILDSANCSLHNESKTVHSETPIPHLSHPSLKSPSCNSLCDYGQSKSSINFVNSNEDLTKHSSEDSTSRGLSGTHLNQSNRHNLASLPNNYNSLHSPSHIHFNNSLLDIHSPKPRLEEFHVNHIMSHTSSPPATPSDPMYSFAHFLDNNKNLYNYSTSHAQKQPLNSSHNNSSNPIHDPSSNISLPFSQSNSTQYSSGSTLKQYQHSNFHPTYLSPPFCSVQPGTGNFIGSSLNIGRGMPNDRFTNPIMNPFNNYLQPTMRSPPNSTTLPTDYEHSNSYISQHKLPSPYFSLLEKNPTHTYSSSFRNINIQQGSDNIYNSHRLDDMASRNMINFYPEMAPQQLPLNRFSQQHYSLPPNFYTSSVSQQHRPSFGANVNRIFGEDINQSSKFQINVIAHHPANVYNDTESQPPPYQCNASRHSNNQYIPHMIISPHDVGSLYHYLKNPQLHLHLLNHFYPSYKLRDSFSSKLDSHQHSYHDSYFPRILDYIIELPFISIYSKNLETVRGIDPLILDTLAALLDHCSRNASRAEEQAYQTYHEYISSSSTEALNGNNTPNPQFLINDNIHMNQVMTLHEQAENQNNALQYSQEQAATIAAHLQQMKNLPLSSDISQCNASNLANNGNCEVIETVTSVTRQIGKSTLKNKRKSNFVNKFIKKTHTSDHPSSITFEPTPKNQPIDDPSDVLIISGMCWDKTNQSWRVCGFLEKSGRRRYKYFKASKYGSLQAAREAAIAFQNEHEKEENYRPKFEAMKKEHVKRN